jgi:hypothetical protein
MMARRIIIGILVALLIAVTVLILGIRHTPDQTPTVDMTEEIRGEQVRVDEFNEAIKEILAAERNPDYAAEKPELVSFAADARRIFHQASTVRANCIASKIPDPRQGQVTLKGEMCAAAISRESNALADVQGIGGGFSDPWQLSHVGKPQDDAETIRPQIQGWSGAVVDPKLDAFEHFRSEIQHYAASVCDPNFPVDWEHNSFESCVPYQGPSTYAHYQTEIKEAKLYQRKANEAAEANDWAGGFVCLRHSELILEDAFDKALQEAYLRSNNYRP